jgi:pyruvate dehydrogenase E2 component (dihydrolipoamide acetyltransferase)
MSDAPGLLDGLAPWPQVDFSEFGEIEAKPISRIQQLTAKFLGRNWVAIPHVTHHDEVDVTRLEARRKAWNAANLGSKVTPLVPVIKALTETLADFPVFNASLDAAGKSLVYKKYFHIGVAVDTPNGLLVPVLRDCDRKTMGAIADELAEISAKARSKGLSLAEMSGGSISVSSLGHIGGTAFTPIINAPEVAILGLTKMQTRAMPDGAGGIDWRLTMPVSLSYDHRVINGADAARFVVALGEKLDGIVFE